MDIKYSKWIKENVPEAYGKCVDATANMAQAFPELKRVRGQYICAIWGERDHWWCVDGMGNIVDPTASQFPSKGLGIYTPWKEGTPEPTGICSDCGGKCYDHRSFCSDECARKTLAYLKTGTL